MQPLHTRTKHLAAVSLLVAALTAGLAACERDAAVPLTPAASESTQPNSVPVAPPGHDPSVPGAATALADKDPAKDTDPTRQTTKNGAGTLTPREESLEMPQPGQANAHSAPNNDARNRD